jgi:hypothetical protein
MSDTPRLDRILESAKAGHFRAVQILSGDSPYVEYTQRNPLSGQRRDDLSESELLALFTELQKFFVVDDEASVDLQIGNPNPERMKLRGHLVEGYLTLGALNVAAEHHLDNYGVEQWYIHPGFSHTADVNAYNRRRAELVRQWHDIVAAGPRKSTARQSLLFTLANEVDLSHFDVRLFARSLGLDVLS